MKKQELVEYLRNLYNIEKIIYEEEKVREYLVRKRDAPVSYYKLQEVCYSHYPKKRYLSAGVYFIIAIISAMAACFVKDEMVSFCLLFLVVIFAFFGIVTCSNIKDIAEKEWEERTKNNEIIKANDILQQKNELIRTQADRNAISAEVQIKLIDNALAETKALRDKYYELDIIHPKYRKDFVAISSIYEFMDTGRCYKLTGPHGAYDTFEYMKELREIKTNLKVIISQLEEIKRNQWMLYDAINESNRLTQVMIDEFQRTEKQLIQANRSLSEIGEYQRQSAEYNRITASNSEFLKWYTVFDKASSADFI